MKCPRCQQDRPLADAQHCPRCAAYIKHAENDSPAASYADVLEQQAATSEILRVISTSPGDLTPVLETVARNAARLCEADDVSIIKAEGDGVTILFSVGPAGAFRGQRFPAIRSVTGRAIHEGHTIHVGDLLADPSYEIRPQFQTFGWRSALAVPLLRNGVAIGTITARRSQVRPFSEHQIKLLETFADQAVIAMENVRLFTELQDKNQALTKAHAQVSESLQQQTATAEILRVISSSPTEVQPVFDTIVESVVQLCDGVSATVYRFDGSLIHLIAHHHSVTSAVREVFERIYPLPPSRTSVVAQAILDRAVVHVRDFDDSAIPLASREMARAVGHRSLVAVPMLRGSDPIGAISVGRRGPNGAVHPFSDSEIALLQTFADQAVIAIENVRLFKELEEKNASLTEALDQQTATSGILRVISSSPTDLQPVFDTIASSALRLCDGVISFVFRHDGMLLHLVALDSVEGVDMSRLRQIFPAPPERVTLAGRVVTTARLLYIADIAHDRNAPPGLVEVAGANGFRSVVAAPMLREGHAIGAIGVAHRDVNGFTPSQCALLETFANQAVIAIENVRLFTETKEVLERQTASSEILKVIASSPTDVQPVFETIVRSAVQLCDGVFSIVGRFDGEYIHFGAEYNFSPEALAAYRLWFPRRAADDRLAGRAVLEQRVMNVADVTAEFRFVPGQQEQGFRSVLFVPMIRDGASIGVIGVSRLAVGPFPDNQVELLKTFADQAVIAIQNVRLFTELETSNRALTETLEQQTATSEVL